MQRKGETAFFFCTAVSERNRMNSFMSWVGGKKALREAIVARLCCSCDRYVEVFGGGAWVLFHKLPGKFEVYNDFNPNLANLYRCVRDHPEDLCEELRYTLNSRVDFDHIREVLRTKTVIPDIRRAAYFYQIIRESYASGLDSFGAQPHNMWRNFPLITEASKRLQSVVIENKDFEKLIQQYDRPNTIFYLDPPYYETEDYYEDVGFGTADHERLCNALMQIKGKFLLSYNDCPQIRQLYSREGIMIESTTRLSNIAQRYDHASRWKDMIGSQVTKIASAMNIPPEHLKWYAAFHNEGHHPHVHIMVYSTDPREGFINEYGIEKIRSAMARDIFAQDLQSIYEDQTEIRQKLKEAANKLIREILSRAENSSYENETVEQKLVLLAEKLKQTKGKKVYGYLNRNTKDLIDSIVDELAKDKTIAELYDLWYEKKHEILGTYSSKRPSKIPLSENQEFKSIKNAIIKEAMNLNQESNQKQTAAHQKSRVSAVAVTRLFRNLCGIFQGKLDDENRQTIHQSAVDRRIRREDEAKRNAELTYD